MRASEELAEFYVHQISARPYAGETGRGSTWGEPVVVPCFVDETARIVRTPTEEAAVSTATITAPPDAVDLPPGSLITLPSGRETVIITQARYLSAGLDLPDHTLWTVE